MTDAMEWLRRERCPYCVKRDKEACAYKVRRTYEGWRCYGYRSKLFDERMWDEDKV